uniref:Uncharacterized protein n=1 Tax=Arabidopsis halleri subsp. halleri TaxID=81971 RepID=I0J3I0_ARAHH|nr:unknown [Arabidopsis halleri subsp. halleri]
MKDKARWIREPKEQSKWLSPQGKSEVTAFRRESGIEVTVKSVQAMSGGDATELSLAETLKAMQQTMSEMSQKFSNVEKAVDTLQTSQETLWESGEEYPARQVLLREMKPVDKRPLVLLIRQLNRWKWRHRSKMKINLQINTNRKASTSSRP